MNNWVVELGFSMDSKEIGGVLCTPTSLISDSEIRERYLIGIKQANVVSNPRLIINKGYCYAIVWFWKIIFCYNFNDNVIFINQ